MTITPRGWAVLGTAAVLLAGGLWAQYPGVAGFGAALLAMVVASAAGVLLPAPLEVSRIVPSARVTRLCESHGTLTVTNRSPWLPVRVEGEDLVGGVPVQVRIPALAAGASRQAGFTVPTARRGTVELGPLTLARRGLARLAVARSAHGERSVVTVVPRVLPVLGLPSGVQRSHVGADERVEHGGTDLVGLHEYVPGDDLRRLHWATSAKTGTLMIRDDADPSLPHLTVLLDDRASSYAGDGFEEAADIAASLINEAATSSNPARLVTVSGALDVDLPAGPESAGDYASAGLLAAPVLDALAGIDPVDGDEMSAAAAALHGSDIVAVVSGERAPTASLLVDAGRSSLGVLALVDAHANRLSDVVGGVVVLRGPRAEDVLNGWDLAVVR
ncbi:DUF58 domain-containing protein [Phytoactinopolyspora alkaliphila]|uniref:DUF58 domain-containing protein n=1 Tax=Phytoactinopolyspora alkaliphila TaxID=1783498 RepID=A0A6N9YSL7_9ACTN|nr:DUF58 domain-containing protein [Phytoactinopolyspora alkaliphila]NED98036.1 DUF58 domain-containing protein [Phytoactinopolyspora alkaliphila]